MTVLLSAQGLTKAFGPRPLFSDISLDLRVGERVGFIGPNGSGKSTLLKIFSGIETPDSGTVALRRGTRLGYLTQEDSFDPEASLGEVVSAALDDERLEDHERHTRVQIALTKVGFEDDSQRAGTLSGGWRKRLALARELAKNPDILLLDEPTNHLDLEGILWLEDFLQDAPFAFLLVSHDRYFLENVTNQIVEINRIYPEGYFRSSGSYSDFLTHREEFLEGQARQEQSLAAKVRREVEWLKRGARARTGKSAARTSEAGRLISELRTVQGRNAPSGVADIDFEATGRKSRKLLTGTGLSKTRGGRNLFADLTFTLTPGSKLGLLGPNGSGKSTLLQLLTGELSPDAGTLERAEALRVSAFSQDRRQLDRNAPLRRALAPNADTVIYRGQPWHVTAWAKRFLFRLEQLDLPVGDLSGGEQARLLLSRLMVDPADVLLLDEPTNDLDLPSLEVLEEALADFPGALILVTHDRSLLDRLCTEIVGLDGEGNARIFADFVQWVAAQKSAREQAKKAKSPATPRVARPAREKAKRLSFKEQREWEGMESRILAAEEAIASQQQALEAAAREGNHVRLQECSLALEAAQQAADALYARWQELESKQESS